jgi:hypothetical protein
MQHRAQKGTDVRHVRSRFEPVSRLDGCNLRECLGTFPCVDVPELCGWNDDQSESNEKDKL